MRNCPACGETIARDNDACPLCGHRLTPQPDGDDDLLDTRPYHPAYDYVGKSKPRLQDTAKQLPAIEMEPDESALVVSTPPSEDSPPDQPAAPLATPAESGGDSGGFPTEDQLGDTLVEVEPGEGQGAKPITFSEVGKRVAVPSVDTGAEPLDFKHFESARDSSRRKEAAPATVEPGGHRGLSVDPLADTRGALRLTKALAWIASLLWVGTAALLVAVFLDLGVPYVDRLPFHVEALTAVPWVFILALVLAASSVKRRVARTIGRPSSWFGALLRSLFLLLLAALPGLGLLLGLGVGLHLIVRKRPVYLAAPDQIADSEYDFATTDRPLGWTMIFFTLSWQEVVIVVALGHFRAYLPF